MGNISDNFDRIEFACNCGCGFDACDIELIKVLEDVRAHFNNRPLNISSGNRCQSYNDAIPGSAKQSKHTKGIACDFSIRGISPKEIYNYLDEKYNKYGIGLYVGWVHVDMRKVKTRW